MRFTFVHRADGRVGVIDTKTKKFAEFHSPPNVPFLAEHRARKVVDRLNSGDDTTTGYVWDPL